MSPQEPAISTWMVLNLPCVLTTWRAGRRSFPWCVTLWLRPSRQVQDSSGRSATLHCWGKQRLYSHHGHTDGSKGRWKTKTGVVWQRSRCKKTDFQKEVILQVCICYTFEPTTNINKHYSISLGGSDNSSRRWCILHERARSNKIANLTRKLHRCLLWYSM